MSSSLKNTYLLLKYYRLTDNIKVRDREGGRHYEFRKRIEEKENQYPCLLCPK